MDSMVKYVVYLHSDTSYLSHPTPATDSLLMDWQLVASHPWGEYLYTI